MAQLASGGVHPRGHGAVLERVLVTRPARVALVLFWWWLGWHFLVARTVDVPVG